MYNEKRKKEYMDTLHHKADVYYIKKVFEASNDAETLACKDLCEFDKEEILDLFEQMEIVQLTMAQGCDTALRKYCKWCMARRYMDETEPVKLSLDEMQSRLTELPEIISYEELQRNENLLLNICDQLILEAIYLGIKGKDYCELFSMSEKDIDVRNKTIKLCTGREIKVTGNFIYLCQTSVNIYDYELISGQKQALIGDLPIKRNAQADKSSGKTKNANVIGGRLCRFKKIPGYKSNLGTTMLFDSGFVNTCKAAMEERGIRDFELFMNTVEGKEIYKQYGMPAKNRSNKIRKYKGYFE